MNRNDQTNTLIKWGVIIGDFVLLNALIWAFLKLGFFMQTWTPDRHKLFWLICNLALLVGEYRFYTVIHLRLVSVSEILRRIVGLTLTHAVVSYLLLKIMDYAIPVGKLLLVMDTVLVVLLLIVRYLERHVVNRYRKSGGNYRTVTMVGSDSELLNAYDRLLQDPTKGYRVIGYYGDGEIMAPKDLPELKKLGSTNDLLDNLDKPQNLELGDDMYVCLSRMQRDVVKKLSRLCDDLVIRFYYVPLSVESIGLNLKREYLDDIEIFATYENPLVNPINKIIKRSFDIVMSSFALLCILPFLPIIAYMIKKQSPQGPVFFKQPRTGQDGKNFYCYKFRSMHPNKDESGLVQATKDDPRKFPFGDFMRKTSVDELPQFWNVLKGEMSIVGPRPHPVKLNEKYTELIDKYMVRHFVKPGLTGWAQVTGFRGETEELWQMEGRVKRDIWYMEHWNFWLDIRILWMTVKQIVMKDKQAY
jgi:putative colanic acid biosynthesis UDP-glucose lipid carrier transferase